MRISKDFDISKYESSLIQLGNTVRAEREKKKLSQTQLAEKVGCNWETISRIENGKVNSFKFIFAIVSVLDCSIDYLTGHDKYTTKDIKGVCEYTGLSEEVVKRLHRDVRFPEHRFIKAGKEVVYYPLPDFVNKVASSNSFISVAMANSNTEYFKASLTHAHKALTADKVDTVVSIDYLLDNLEKGLNYATSQKLIEEILNLRLGFHEEDFE